MSAFGAMFPGNRIRHEGGESGNAQDFLEFGPIDLESGTVTLQSGGSIARDEDTGDIEDTPAQPDLRRRGDG